MNAFSFTLSSTFGLFQWEKTKGDQRITNLFISKTEVLGILGAVLGLDGYSQVFLKEKHQLTATPFYESLRGLEIAILPEQHPAFFEDHLIHRYMHAVNSKGPLMAKLTGLVRPRYKIVVTQGSCQEDVFRQLITYMEKGWSEFIPYMGKNQYPAVIENFQQETLRPHTTAEAHRIDSLYKEKHVLHREKIRPSRLIKQDYHYTNILRSFEDDRPVFQNEPHCWSSFAVQLECPVVTLDSGESITFL